MLTRWQVHQFVINNKVLESSTHELYLYLDICKPNLQARDKKFTCKI